MMMCGVLCRRSWGREESEGWEEDEIEKEDASSLFAARALVSFAPSTRRSRAFSLPSMIRPKYILRTETQSSNVSSVKTRTATPTNPTAVLKASS